VLYTPAVLLDMAQRSTRLCAGSKRPGGRPVTTHGTPSSIPRCQWAFQRIAMQDGDACDIMHAPQRRCDVSSAAEAYAGAWLQQREHHVTKLMPYHPLIFVSTESARA